MLNVLPYGYKQLVRGSTKMGYVLRLHPEALEVPLGWKKPKVVFVNSMSDLLHRDVPIEFVRRVFTVMRYAPQHQFQILTKRTDRLAQLDPERHWVSPALMRSL